MDLELAGRRVLVTGGSKGIGYAVAERFSAEGAEVTLVARSDTALTTAADHISAKTGKAVRSFTADLASDAGRIALFETCGDVDILINNAGAIKAGGLTALSMDEWREGWELKVFGYIHLCQLFAPVMAKRESGTIINIIGMGGRAVRPNYICGAAGNAALIGFTNALGAEAARSNYRVFGINPSPTLTDRMKTMFMTRARDELGDETRWEELLDPGKFPYGRPKLPDEVGALAVMLASPLVQYLSGTVIDMDGGGQWIG